MNISGINLGKINPGDQPENNPAAEAGKKSPKFNPNAQVSKPGSSGAIQAMLNRDESSHQPAIVDNKDGTYSSEVEAIGEVKLTAAGLQGFKERLENDGIRLQEKAMVNSAKHFGAGNPHARSAIGSVYLAL